MHCIWQEGKMEEEEESAVLVRLDDMCQLNVALTLTRLILKVDMLHMDMAKEQAHVELQLCMRSADVICEHALVQTSKDLAALT